MTLLDEAKKIKVNRKKADKYSEEQLEVCIAWVKQEITLSQLSGALQSSGGNGLYTVAKAMRLLFEAGRLTFKK